MGVHTDVHTVNPDDSKKRESEREEREGESERDTDQTWLMHLF